jgi:hypothetical protein
MIGLLWLRREGFRRPGTDPPFSEQEFIISSEMLKRDCNEITIP